MLLMLSLSARRAWIEIHYDNYNLHCTEESLSARRAWIEIKTAEIAKTSNASLSARRAWIEIKTRSQPSKLRHVALRKESVDRNPAGRHIISQRVRSLSARRAWIEIIDYVIDYATDAVALRKESVDRNPLR